MRAVVYESFQQPPAVTTVDDPSPPAHGVVVEVTATGVCRSDWHGWMGHDADITLPHVPGHELAGRVVAVGADVRRLREGDRVTVPFVSGCGMCPVCRQGDPQVCPHQTQPGFTHWGSFAEQVVLHRADANVVALPDEVDDATAASLGCRFATAFRAVVDQGRVSGGDWVAVHGCGGVGLSAVMIATALGAQVIAVDVNDAALRLAADLGAVATIPAPGPGEPPADIPGAVRELTGGLGAHVSLDALGHTTTATNSILCLRPRGRHVQVGLLAGEHANPSLPIGRVIAAELEFHGSHGMAAHRYDAMLSMISAEHLAPERLITRRISLDEAPQALMAIGDRPPAGVTVVTSF